VCSELESNPVTDFDVGLCHRYPRSSQRNSERPAASRIPS
jgi:hypothetical protein